MTKHVPLSENPRDSYRQLCCLFSFPAALKQHLTVNITLTYYHHIKLIVLCHLKKPALIIVKCVPLACRQGASCSVDDLTASAFLTVEVDRSLGGNAVQVQPV